MYHFTYASAILIGALNRWAENNPTVAVSVGGTPLMVES